MLVILPLLGSILRERQGSHLGLRNAEQVTYKAILKLWKESIGTVQFGAQEGAVVRQCSVKSFEGWHLEIA